MKSLNNPLFLHLFSLPLAGKHKADYIVAILICLFIIWYAKSFIEWRRFHNKNNLELFYESYSFMSLLKV